MQYRTFGKTGIKVSALGFGCMRFPMVGPCTRASTVQGKEHVKVDETVEMLRHAIDLGINYFDTGSGYCAGESQSAIGKAIKGRRDDVLLSAKNLYKGDDVGEWRAVFERSLEQMDVSCIDFYNLHDLLLHELTDHLIPCGAIDAALKAKEEGMIRHFCVSTHDSPENIKTMIDMGFFEGVTLQYNLLDTHNEEIMAYAHEKGLGVSIMGTVGAGRLVPPSETLQNLIPGEPTSPEIAIRFVLDNPNVDVALSGMASIAEVDENVASASREEPMTEEERSHMLRIRDEIKALADLYCTGCGYCMPCPHGVDIPGNFYIMNMDRVWNLLEPARARYLRLTPKKGKAGPWADDCIGCKLCESKCPQNIPIADQMKEVVARLSPNRKSDLGTRNKT